MNIDETRDEIRRPVSAKFEAYNNTAVTTIEKLANERLALQRENQDLRRECKRLRDAVTKLDGLFTDEGEFRETHAGQLEAALEASQAVLHGPKKAS